MYGRTYDLIVQGKKPKNWYLMWWLHLCIKDIYIRMRTGKNIKKWKISDLLGSWDSGPFSFPFVCYYYYEIICVQKRGNQLYQVYTDCSFHLWRNIAMYKPWHKYSLLQHGSILASENMYALISERF